MPAAIAAEAVALPEAAAAGAVAEAAAPAAASATPKPGKGVAGLAKKAAPVAMLPKASVSPKRAARASARKALAPTQDAVSSLSGLFWKVLGVVIALALLLLVLNAAERTTRISEAADGVTSALRQFVNPFGDNPLGPLAPRAAPSPAAARAARAAATTSYNPHTVHV